jgi:hypothetical protein
MLLLLLLSSKLLLVCKGDFSWGRSASCDCIILRKAVIKGMSGWACPWAIEHGNSARRGVGLGLHSRKIACLPAANFIFGYGVVGVGDSGGVGKSRMRTRGWHGRGRHRGIVLLQCRGRRPGSHLRIFALLLQQHELHLIVLQRMV